MGKARPSHLPERGGHTEGRSDHGKRKVRSCFRAGPIMPYGRSGIRLAAGAIGYFVNRQNMTAYAHSGI